MPDQECISSRAVTFVPQAPQFFDVLDDLWHPESNPNGIVNLGLAENVGKNLKYFKPRLQRQALMQTELNEFLNCNVWLLGC